MTRQAPFRFGQLTLPEALSAETFLVDGDEIPAWLTVEGGGLEQPIAIRLARIPPARYAITGLAIANDATGPITSHTLRSIRLAALLEELVDYLNDNRAGLTGPDAVDWFLSGGDVIATAGSSPVAPSGPRKRGVSPSENELRQFAQVYMAQLQRRPHRAMTSAAELASVSRTTANRWAALCRERGYLPPKEGS